MINMNKERECRWWISCHNLATHLVKYDGTGGPVQVCAQDAAEIRKSIGRTNVAGQMIIDVVPMYGEVAVK